MTARQKDVNDYITIKRNPISRTGVFQYLGKSIGADDPEKVYNVYRPAEALADPEAINSFKLIPIINDHEMLGGSDSGHTAAEDKGVHGSTGEEVFFENDVLYSNLKIFSQDMPDLLKQGKKDLSLGYRCKYTKQQGVFNGQTYDYIQTELRGNHLALVDRARCNVAVLDHSDGGNITFDNFDINTEKELDMTPEEMKKAMDEALSGVTSQIKLVADRLDAMDESSKKAAEDKKAMEEKEAADKKEKDEKEAKEAEDKKTKGMDAEEVKALHKTMMAEYASRAKLADTLSHFTGAFDHSEMSADEIAAYGCEKLGIKADKAHARAALDGFFAGKDTKMRTVVMDEGDSVNSAQAYLDKFSK